MSDSATTSRSALRHWGQAVGVGHGYRPRDLALRMLARTAYRRLVLFRAAVETSEAISPLPSGVSVELLEDGGLEEYHALRPDTASDEVRRRLSRGDKCFVTRRGGRMVVAVWISHGSARSPYLRCELPLADDAVYFHDGFTAAHVRGEGMLGTAREAVDARLHKDGFREKIALVLPENYAGVRATVKAGFCPVALFATLTIGSRRWVFRRRLPRSVRGSSRYRAVA